MPYNVQELLLVAVIYEEFVLGTPNIKASDVNSAH